MKRQFGKNPEASIWEHLIDDLLEISCAATKASRDFLCRMLRIRRVSAESIQRHLSFTIDRLVVVIREEGDIDECWFFDPKLKRIKKLIKE